MKVLDLFSGLGGFSEAFLRAGDEVVRVENNPLLQEVPCTTLQDVREMRDRLRQFKDEGQPIRKIDLLLASPPCLEFSMGFHAPQAIAARENRLDSYQPDLEMIEITLEIIQLINPRWFVIENVIGSIGYFEDLGLIPNQIHGSCVFYGKFPKFSTPKMKTKAEKDSYHGDPLRMNKRALIPFELSMALRKAIISQKTLFDDYNIA
jgi:hypothetical protein